MLGYQEFIDESWRGDTARYAYLLRQLDLRPQTTVADIGANTGFFVLSLAHQAPDCRFIAYESHPNHVDFIRLVAEADLSNVAVEEKPVGTWWPSTIFQVSTLCCISTCCTMPATTSTWVR